jgi:hypothetical protein
MKRGWVCGLVAGFMLSLIVGCGGGPKNVAAPTQVMQPPKQAPVNAGMQKPGGGK